MILPIVVLAPPTAANAQMAVRTTDLLDTGATATGVRADVAEELQLRPKGMRRIGTANGLLMATEYTLRIGFIAGDHRDAAFIADLQLPYVIDDVFTGFELQRGFGYPVLIGMDVLGRCRMTIDPDGEAQLDLC